MKIVFLGTPEFALASLNSLSNDPNIDIVTVVTQPDKPVGRKQVLTPPPVKVLAEKIGLKVIQPKNNEELYDNLANIKADFFIVIAFGMILPKKILDIPTYGSINVHASLLPKYRGASPIQQSILKGDDQTGISIMKMDEKLDHGPVYIVKRMPISPKDTSETLSTKLSFLGGEILPSVLHDIVEENLKAIPQNHKQASHCKKIKKEDGKIDWNKSATEIMNMMRAFTPWPGIYTNFKNKKLKIIQAEKEDGNLEIGEFKLNGKKLMIGTGDGVITPSEVQIEGKKACKISDFINGNKNDLK